MAKLKQKTTALPPAGKRVVRKYKSRSEREAETNRLILIITGVIVALILGVLGIALLIDGVIKPNQAVASAGNQQISAQEFERRVRFERWKTGVELNPIANSQFGQQLLANPQYGPYADMYQRLQQPASMGQYVLDQMIDNLVIQQYAVANNITLSEDEINQKVYDYFGFKPTVTTDTPTPVPTLTLTPLVSATPSSTPTVTPTTTMTATPSMTPFPTGVPTATPGATEQFKDYTKNSQDYFDAAVKATNYSPAEIRKVLEEEALREKVKKAVIGDIPKEQEQIKSRHILLKTTEDAQEVLAALQSGEPFAALASAVSTDPGSKSTGGELGWQGKGAYVPEFDDAIWNAKIGDIIGPIDTTKNGTQYGYHIIQIEGRENRPLTNDEGANVQERLFQDWLKAQREAKNAKTFDAWYEYTPSDPTLAQLGLPDSVTGQ